MPEKLVIYQGNNMRKTFYFHIFYRLQHRPLNKLHIQHVSV